MQLAAAVSIPYALNYVHVALIKRCSCLVTLPHLLILVIWHVAGTFMSRCLLSSPSMLRVQLLLTLAICYAISHYKNSGGEAASRAALSFMPTSLHMFPASSCRDNIVKCTKPKYCYVPQARKPFSQYLLWKGTLVPLTCGRITQSITLHSTRRYAHLPERHSAKENLSHSSGASSIHRRVTSVHILKNAVHVYSASKCRFTPTVSSANCLSTPTQVLAYGNTRVTTAKKRIYALSGYAAASKSRGCLDMLHDNQTAAYGSAVWNSTVCSSPSLNFRKQAIQRLREATGVGMQECLKALQINDFKVEAAIQQLVPHMQTNVLSRPMYKVEEATVLNRIGKDSQKLLRYGWVGLKCGPTNNSTKGILLELKCETSFVAQNTIFQNLLKDALTAALSFDATLFEAMNISDFLESAYVPSSPIVGIDPIKKFVLLSEMLEMVSKKLGEKIQFGRKAVLELRHSSSAKDAVNGIIGVYVHNAVEQEIGQIGVLVGLQYIGKVTESEKVEALNQCILDLAMHVAAAKPLVTRIEDLKQSEVDLQKNLMAHSIKTDGKSQSIIDRILDGKMKRFYEENVLVEQEWYLDDSKRKVSEIVSDLAKTLKVPCKIVSFRFLKINE